MKFITILAFFASFVASRACTAVATGSSLDAAKVSLVASIAPSSTETLDCAPGYALSSPGATRPTGVCPVAGRAGDGYTIQNASSCVPVCRAPSSPSTSVKALNAGEIPAPGSDKTLKCAPGFTVKEGGSDPIARCPDGGDVEYTILNANDCVEACTAVATGSSLDAAKVSSVASIAPSSTETLDCAPGYALSSPGATRPTGVCPVAGRAGDGYTIQNASSCVPATTTTTTAKKPQNSRARVASATPPVVILLAMATYHLM